MKSSSSGILYRIIVTGSAIVSAGLRPSFGHEVLVHENITFHAASSAAELSPNYRDFLQLIIPPGGSSLLSFNGSSFRPAGWLTDGAAKEDNVDVAGDLGGKRPYNHFYDPLSGEGLSDFPLQGKLSAPYGRDSFKWTSVLNSPGIDFRSRVPRTSNIGTINEWSWQNAREFERLGLIAASTTAREESLAKMFRALGDTVHLLQDTTQPQHTRNEQHLDKILGLSTKWRSPIELYGLKNAGAINYAHGVLDWRKAGFTKLEDFWDRNKYTWNRATPSARSPQALVAHEVAVQSQSSTPQDQLGLAEFVNGNFIGDRHTYREFFPAANPFHYPFPSLDEGTDYAALRANPSSKKKFTSVPQIGTGYRYIVGKETQGRTVARHGAITYLTVLNADLPSFLLGTYSASVDDPDVLKDYHDILVPEAIKYSAGVLDYFFRGRIDVATTFSSTPGKVGLRVTNKSGQALKDGTFKLYYDDTAGVRTEITSPSFSLPLAGTLADNASLTTDFTPPASPPVSYLLVYKGTIGVNGATALDPVDKEIAIAAKRFTRDAFIDVIDFQAEDLAQDGTIAGFRNVGGAQRPYYYSGLTRTSQDTRTSVNSSPITVTQSATTVTASDVFFSPAHTGRIIKFASGETATITAYVSPTQVTVTPSQTVPSTTLLLQGNTLGGNNGIGWVCNANGILAGQEDTLADLSHGFWLNTVTGEIRDLGANSYPLDIDSVGWLLIQNYVLSRGYLYNPATQTFTDLGLLDSQGQSYPIAMNATHKIALNSGTYHPNMDPWTRASFWVNGVITDIHPAAAGEKNSHCTAINASGTIIGDFDDSSGIAQAFVNFGGSSIQVGDPQKHTAFNAINDNNVVAGGQQVAGNDWRAFKWTSAPGIEFLPLPQGITSSAAYAINNSGDIVGEMDHSAAAFLYRGGNTYKLIDLIAGIPSATGWTELSIALFINDNNDIVGYGFRSGELKWYRLHLPP